MAKTSGSIKVQQRALEALVPYARNARTHSDAQVAQIAASIREFGWTNPVLIDGENGIIAGHGRVLAARKLGLTEVPCIELSHLTEAQRRAYMLADNQLAMNAGWDMDLLQLEIGDLQLDGFNLDLIGFDDGFLASLGGASEEGTGSPAGGSGALSDRFLVPPFSVLNAREGWWQDRKRAWLSLGIQSELGRGEVMGTLASARKAQKAAPGRSALPASDYGKSGARGDGTGKAADDVEGWVTSSIFDPVLCELAYLWFCPPGGVVLDPFAGGSVRGIVAAQLGREYIGCELRAEQVAANQEQAERISRMESHTTGVPVWHQGDSARTIPALDVAADFVFSCPPYGDLEVYSDDASDLSNMDRSAFAQAYRDIIKAAVAKLKADRFACFVVGDYRLRDGGYANFVSETIGAFEAAGARLYNEAILVTAVGSLPVRAGRTFSATRKLGKTHQNVLVFVKGNAKRATEACGAVDVTDALAAVAELEPA